MASLLQKHYRTISIWGIGILGNLALAFLLSECVLAQNIALDGTLGERRTLTGPNYIIRQTDGQTVGNNLFHSFGKFGLDRGEAATFQSSAKIDNIFSRVTGNSPSKIDGLIATTGTRANLFLMNPNGIIFGKNASLDIKGSFVATTANAIQFGDRGFFSATNPQSPALLTVKPSAFFFNQISPAAITNRAKEGLEVSKGNSIVLVGGDIDFDGGKLKAPEGKVELGGLSEPGIVTLSNNFNLTFPSQIARSDIYFAKKASVDVSGEGGGAIQIQGRQISLTDESKITAETRGEKDGQGIVIGAQTLTIQEGAQISSATSGRGKGGNIDIDATESVELIGTSGDIDKDKPSKIATDSQSSNNNRNNNRDRPCRCPEGNRQEIVGEPGILTIRTRELLIKDGARISSSVSGQKPENQSVSETPTISIIATDSVTLIGTSPGERRSSAISVQTSRGNKKAGNIAIATRHLTLQDGAEISAATFGAGNGGNIAIDADTVEVVGASATGKRISRIFAGTGDPEEVGRDDDSGANFNIDKNEITGDGGNIEIISKRLAIADEAQISVNEEGMGKAGDINITTDFLSLDSQGQITASTQSGDGGNIDLTANNLLLLRRESDIRTDAGVAGAGGDGGNIDIFARFIIATPSENSDITANAFEGKGGNINITTDGIFGIEFRQQPTSQSDITASSRFGLNGTVFLNILEVNPVYSLAKLPSATVDRASLIAQNVCAIRDNRIAGGSSFVITGKGGLPNNPNEPLSNLTGIVEWANPDVEEQVLRPVDSKSDSPQERPIQEAQGWIQNPDGTIALVAQSPTVTPQNPNFQLPDCSITSQNK
jgi:filamentous hemagglutinin family protein